MAIFIYKKHPAHNLGGENYPHFRNQADKLVYALEFIDITKGIDFEITRTSFDTAVVNLNITTQPPQTISGIASGEVHATGELNLEFWWVVGWNAGANTSVVSFNLTLDYWMTYWPLKFNKALVRIGRKHMNRFGKRGTDLTINFCVKNKQLAIPEQATPPNIVNIPEEINWKPSILQPNSNKITLMVGIVISSIGGTQATTNNLYISKLGYNPPTYQNAFVIFGDYNTPEIYTWLAFPGITQTFYFWFDKNRMITPRVLFNKPTSGLIGNYGVQIAFLASKKTDLKVASLNGAEVTGNAVEQYQKVIQMVSEISLFNKTLENSPGLSKADKLLYVDNTYRIHYDYIQTLEKTNQLVNLKGFFRNNYLKVQNNVWKDQVLRKFKNVYFTTLNFFNQALNLTNLNFFQLDLPLQIKNHQKTDSYNFLNELKIYADHQYFLRFLEEKQAYPLHLYIKQPYLPVGAGFGQVNFISKQYATTNNFYLYFQLNYFTDNRDGGFNLPDRKYNFVLQNKTKLLNYTDESIKFYQQQGNSFKVGLEQAKYQLNWLKRYQNFQSNAFKYRQITGVIKGVAGDIMGAVGAVAGAKTGNITSGQASGLALGLGFDIADRSVNTGFNFQEFNLNQELARKNSIYSVKSMLARQADIFNQPINTNGVIEDELQIKMLNKNTDIHWTVDFPEIFKPGLMVMTPTITDWKYQALIYHKSGNVADQLEQVDLNSNKTRRCWNFWEIHNIEQVIIKDNLNSMVINYFNKKFNDGIRLWNIFHAEVKFNDYSLANWEHYLLTEAEQKENQNENQ